MAGRPIQQVTPLSCLMTRDYTANFCGIEDNEGGNEDKMF